MRIYLTGASGFVGSNLAHVFAHEHGAEVVAPGHEHVDLTDRAGRAPLGARHPAGRDRARGDLERPGRRSAPIAGAPGTRTWAPPATWSAAANAVDAHVVLISTDWVFDGTQGPADRVRAAQPDQHLRLPQGVPRSWSSPNRAARGTVARIAGVQGIHRARPHTPRAQDAGFGYLVASLVDALRAGERFTVWDGPGLNQLATPTLATDAAELVWRALDARGHRHPALLRRRARRPGGPRAPCDRGVRARRRTCSTSVPPPPEALAAGAVPRDTRLDAAATARALDAELPDLDTMLGAAAGRGGVIMERRHESSHRRPGAGPLPRGPGGRARRPALAASSPAASGIFGHGNVAGLGQALHQYRDLLPYHPARNEQAMVHVAAGYARQRNRLGTFACTTSVGPGRDQHGDRRGARDDQPPAGAAAPRRHVRHPHAAPGAPAARGPADATVSVNDCFRPVSRYYERVERPEQLIPAALEAMRVLTDPAETGAVTLAMPEDVQAEAFEVPDAFLEQRVWTVYRQPPAPDALARAAELIRAAQRPLIVAGGGVIYSEAIAALRALVDATGIPVGETQAGRGALVSEHPLSLGAIGATGTSAANRLARDADLVIGIGTRWSDFTTASKSAFQDPACASSTSTSRRSTPAS